MSDHLTFEGNVISSQIAFLVDSFKELHGYPMSAEWNAQEDISRLLRSGLALKLAKRVTKEIDRHRDGVVRVHVSCVVEYLPKDAALEGIG